MGKLLPGSAPLLFFQHRVFQGQVFEIGDSSIVVICKMFMDCSKVGESFKAWASSRVWVGSIKTASFSRGISIISLVISFILR